MDLSLCKYDVLCPERKNLGPIENGHFGQANGHYG